MMSLKITHRKVIDALFILTLGIFTIVQNTAAEETTGGGLPNTLINYPGLKPKIYPAPAVQALPVNDKRSALMHNERGVAYSEKSQYDLALVEFNKALKIDPPAVGIYNNRGITFSEKGQYQLAISDFTKALEIDNNDARTYYNRGMTYAIVSRFDLALADFNKYLELNPVNAAVYDARGNIHAALACSD